MSVSYGHVHAPPSPFRPPPVPVRRLRAPGRSRVRRVAARPRGRGRAARGGDGALRPVGGGRAGPTPRDPLGERRGAGELRRPAGRPRRLRAGRDRAVPAHAAHRGGAGRAAGKARPSHRRVLRRRRPGPHHGRAAGRGAAPGSAGPPPGGGRLRGDERGHRRDVRPHDHRRGGLHGGGRRQGRGAPRPRAPAHRRDRRPALHQAPAAEPALRPRPQAPRGARGGDRRGGRPAGPGGRGRGGRRLRDAGGRPAGGRHPPRDPGPARPPHRPLAPALSRRRSGPPPASRYTSIWRNPRKAVYFIYSVVLGFGFALALPWFLWKGRATGKYFRTFRERMGRLPVYLNMDGDRSIWVHAVSVGEVLATRPLIPALKQRYPHHKVFLSTTTMTGNAVAQKSVRGVDGLFYAPFDWPGPVKKALATLKPSLLVLVETEIWPNLIHEAHLGGARIAIVNGRISRESFAGYRWILGGEARRDRPLWVAGSTVSGEEELILQAYHRVRERVPLTGLVLAPRHPERFPQVPALVESAGFRCLRRTNLEPGAWRDGEVVLLDTLGELAQLYPLASVVFVGGSLVPSGGHNILEAAVAGKPVIVGPHMQNFQEIAEKFRAEGALLQVESAEDLAREVISLLTDEARRRSLGERAKSLVDRNRGALRNTIDGLA